MMKTKRFLALFLTLTMIVSMIVSVPASATEMTFTDVPADYWAYEDIKAILDRDILQYSETFRPEDGMTRRAFLAILSRQVGMDERGMGDEKWDALFAYAYYRGWYTISEINDTNKGSNITRELAAKLLITILFPDQLVEGTVDFTDADSITSSYLPYIKTAEQLGIIGGYSDGTFRPANTLTRAAACAILNRALKLLDTEKGASVQVPILMYHEISNNASSSQCITPEAFRSQLQELKNAGFNTIFYSQLIDYVENGTALPSKPVIITIDDGYDSNYEYAYPILKDLNMKAEISVITSAMDQYWGLTWEHMQEMVDSGLVSIQSHTNNMHNNTGSIGGRDGVLKTDYETWGNYIAQFSYDIYNSMNIIEQHLGTRPIVLTYPRGLWNPVAEAVSESLGCKVSVSTDSGINTVTVHDSDTLRVMKRIDMNTSVSSSIQALQQLGYTV